MPSIGYVISRPEDMNDIDIKEDWLYDSVTDM